MPYSILAVNPGHNGAAALVVDGEVVYYTEEERLSRMKYDGNPFRAMIHILMNHRIDELVIGGTNPQTHQLPWTGEDSYTALVRKFNPNVIFTDLRSEHHLSHAAGAFYNSGFDEAICLIVDGSGSLKREQINETESEEGYETESIFAFEYPFNAKLVHKTYAGSRNIKNKYFDFDDAVTVTKTYEAATHYLGFGFIEAGKTMGLSSYGGNDERIPNLYVGNRGSKDVFLPFYPAGAIIDETRNLDTISDFEKAIETADKIRSIVDEMSSTNFVQDDDMGSDFDEPENHVQDSSAEFLTHPFAE